MNRNGLSSHPLYNVWRGMLLRCYYKKHDYFHRYGGRGIKMCEAWKDDFIVFYDWAMNKWKLGLQLDRIDNDGNYEPGNCHFVTRKQNLRNKSNCTYIEHEGQTKTLKEWSEHFDIPYKRLHWRINRQGWEFKRAVTEDANNGTKIYCHNNDKYYNSILQASQDLGISDVSIGKVIRGERMNTKGHFFSSL